MNVYSELWRLFVSELVLANKDGRKITDKAKDYYPLVQHSLSILGWVLYDRGFLYCNLFEGKEERPDFLLRGKNMFIPIVVKIPSDVMSKADIEQLTKYVQFCDSNIGIYIGEHVRVFYRPTSNDELKIVIDAALTDKDIEGLTFADLFLNNPRFDVESLKSNLDILYRLERVIDDYKVTRIVSKAWIKDRYRKRELLR